MKIFIYELLLFLFVNGCHEGVRSSGIENIYPKAIERNVSIEYTTYFIDPVNGSDDNTGTEKKAPWKTFQKINQLVLTKGNKVEILSPGTFRESLFLIGKGTSDAPIKIKFASGEYNFFPEDAFKTKFHISNTNDSPDSLKAIAFYFLDSENVKIEGNDAEIVFRGKTMELCLNNCNNINITGIGFNYRRPTVSEMKVIAVGNNYADIQIHKDSKYEIVDSTLIWVGEGWKHNAQTLWQVYNSKDKTVSRKSLPIQNMHFSEPAPNKLRVYFDTNPGLTKGLIYQNRNTFRDYAAIFIKNSKTISLNNVNVYFMHGMGIVSQYSEDISIDSLTVKPKKNSGRTCAAWADIIHFSGCKGNLIITNSYLTAANDDAINVHGTYLRIVDELSNRKIKVRFMHPQTFGFDAFHEGDSIEFIAAKTLLPYSRNKVINVEKLNDKEILLSLEQNIPASIQTNDVIENITQIPNVTIRNNKIALIPTRGILVTTRGKVVIENNEFLKTHMSAILIANDANSWFESGYVRNVTIQNNKFIECGEPVINIHPENSEIVDEYPVHKNIQITNNQFILKNNVILSAKSTGNLKFTNNKINSSIKLNRRNLINIKDCYNVVIKNNQLNNRMISQSGIAEFQH